MMNFFVKYLTVLDDCGGIITTEIYEIIQWAFTAIQISTPILVLVLSVVDLLRATTAGKEDEIKKAQSSMVKRIIIGVIIFFVPIVVNILLNIAGINSSTCGLGA